MIAATLHGPNYWAPNHDENSVEVFDDLGDAIDALISRYRSGNYALQNVRYLNGKAEAVMFPAFTEGTRFEVYVIGDILAELPNDDVTEDVLSNVHTGSWDYTLTLEYVGDRISVTVVPG